MHISTRNISTGMLKTKIFKKKIKKYTNVNEMIKPKLSRFILLVYLILALTLCYIYLNIYIIGVNVLNRNKVEWAGLKD